jgi:1-acyl-sn-glycerol-3-phosphate acyltransferase
MRPFYRFSYTLIGIHLRLLHRIRIEGRGNIPAEACLIVGNHASFLDPTTIGWSIPREIYFFGRKNLFRPPVLSWLLPMCNVLPIDQEAPDITGLRRVLKLLKSGESLLVFPEGSRSEDGKLQRAEPGAGLLAAKSGLPVLPVRLFGSHESFPRGAKFPRPHPLRVVIGQPYQPTLTPGRKPDYQAIADEMMAKIAELA